MFIAQVLHAFQFEDKRILHQDVGKVLANTITFVVHRNRSLANRAKATVMQFFEQSTLIDLFQEACPKRVRDLNHSPNYSLCKFVICVHLCSSVANSGCPG